MVGIRGVSRLGPRLRWALQHALYQASNRVSQVVLTTFPTTRRRFLCVFWAPPLCRRHLRLVP